MKVWLRGESPNGRTASNWLQDKASGSTKRAELRPADGLVCCSADVLVRNVFWPTETHTVTTVGPDGCCCCRIGAHLCRLNTSGSVWRELLLDGFLESLFLMSHFNGAKVTTQNTKGSFLLQYHNQPLGRTRLPPVTAIVKNKTKQNTMPSRSSGGYQANNWVPTLTPARENLLKTKMLVKLESASHSYFPAYGFWSEMKHSLPQQRNKWQQLN